MTALHAFVMCCLLLTFAAACSGDMSLVKRLDPLAVCAFVLQLCMCMYAGNWVLSSQWCSTAVCSSPLMACMQSHCCNCCTLAPDAASSLHAICWSSKHTEAELHLPWLLCLQLCNGPTIERFRPEELEQLVCGSRELDFDELESACSYEDGFTSTSEVY